MHAFSIIFQTKRLTYKEYLNDLLSYEVSEVSELCSKYNMKFLIVRYCIVFFIENHLLSKVILFYFLLN